MSKDKVWLGFANKYSYDKYIFRFTGIIVNRNFAN